MLRYNLSSQKIASDFRNVELLEWGVYDVYENDEQSLLVCRYKDNGYVRDGKRINLTSRLVNNDKESGYSTARVYQQTTIHTLAGIRPLTHTFSLLVDKYNTLSVNSWTQQKNAEGELTTFIFFNHPHFFTIDEETIASSLTIDGETTESIGNPLMIEVLFYGIGDNNANERFSVQLKCHYAGFQMLECDLRLVDGENSGVEHLDQLLMLLTNGNDTDDEMTFDTTKLMVRRKNHRFGRLSSIGVVTEVHTIGVPMPMGVTESVSGFQEMAVERDFIEYEKSKAINGVVDMEKDVYHPVIYDTDTHSIQPVYHIIFNLHFRQHRGDEWQASPESYWNGMVYNEENDELKALGDYTPDTPDKETEYFVYDTKSRQSDLLGKLGFTDADVRYQKSKLKRSFLRLLFYDSPNPTDQNLLYTSTIFFDTNLAYAKLLRHQDDSLSVALENTVAMQDRNDEEYRLSSQFIVSDSYMSDKSSEGFYLYLWRNGEQKLTPTDLYMKVEFNHAGFGRTIPFMMPFWDTKKWNDQGKQGIKTFDEIIDDWNPQNAGKSQYDGEYGIKQYTKFSYIRFRYRYDSTTQQHIYYLNDVLYGKKVPDGGVHFTDNQITLDLYEAKMI